MPGHLAAAVGFGFVALFGAALVTERPASLIIDPQASVEVPIPAFVAQAPACEPWAVEPGESVLEMPERLIGVALDAINDQQHRDDITADRILLVIGNRPVARMELVTGDCLTAEMDVTAGGMSELMDDIHQRISWPPQNDGAMPVRPRSHA